MVTQKAYTIVEYNELPIVIKQCNIIIEAFKKKAQ